MTDELLEETEVETPDVEDSGDDDLRATLEAEFSNVESETPAPSLEEDAEALASTKEEKLRDESGRFAKSKPKTEEPAVGAHPTASAQADDTSIPPPTSWLGEKKELFKQLPRPIQEEVARRELERERAFTQKAEEAAKYRRTVQEIDEVFSPYRRELDLAGVPPTQVMRQLLTMQEWLQSEPKAAINHILRSYNLTPQDLAESANAAPMDPHFQSLQEKIEQLESYINNQQEAEVNQSRIGVESEIQSFANEKDANGNLAYPHFQDVYYEMLPITQALREANPTAAHREILKAAYDRAIYSHPEVRKTIISRLAQESQVKRINEAKTQAQKAKIAGSSVRGSAGRSIAAVAPDDLRSTLEQAFEENSL